VAGREDCLDIAAALEQRSEHPLARALRAEAGTDGVQAVAITARAGEGIEGCVDGQRYRIGTPAFVLALQDDAVNQAQVATNSSGDDAIQADDPTGVLLGSEQALLAHFSFSDRLREHAARTVQGLRALGLEVELLSGDEANAVQAVADELGIVHVQSRCRPGDKLARIQALQAQGAVVAMVGDGVNDAPVLAGAQVSLAMGGGTQLAHASADMVLLSEQLPHLVAAVRTSRRTLSIIRQNLGWALVYNLIALPLAAGGWIAPWMAAIGMSSSSLVVVLNALRLRKTPEG
jgi:Cu2+-exporting ATPase